MSGRNTIKLKEEGDEEAEFPDGGDALPLSREEHFAVGSEKTTGRVSFG